MRIDNNYTQRQPNFGKLKSINYCSMINLDTYPKEITKLVQTLKESTAFNDFFKKYDVDLYLKADWLDPIRNDTVNLVLKTEIPQTESVILYPELIFTATKGIFDSNFTLALKNLTKQVKKTETSDLQDKLFKLLKKLEEKEKQNKLKEEYEVGIVNLINDINSKKSINESQSTKTKKTFFEKLFGWLK